MIILYLYTSLLLALALSFCIKITVLAKIQAQIRTKSVLLSYFGVLI